MAHCLNMNFSLNKKITLNNVQNRRVLVVYNPNKLYALFYYMCAGFSCQIHVFITLLPSIDIFAICRACACAQQNQAKCLQPLFSLVRYTYATRCTNNVLNVEIRIVEIANDLCEGTKSRNIPYI